MIRDIVEQIIQGMLETDTPSMGVDLNEQFGFIIAFIIPQIPIPCCEESHKQHDESLKINGRLIFSLAQQIIDWYKAANNLNAIPKLITFSVEIGDNIKPGMFQFETTSNIH